MKKSIRDIAREAGVSIATVSRVCNHPALVAEETRARVTKLLHQANLHPSDSSQFGLRRTHKHGTGRIGLLVPDTPHPSVEAINEEIFKGVRQVAFAHGLEAVLDFYHPDSDVSPMIPKMLSDDSVDGLLVRSGGKLDLISQICCNRKAILIGSAWENTALPGVMEDNAAVMNMAIDYLAELGHRAIGFVGGPLDRLFNRQCLRSYREELERRGFPQGDSFAKIHPSATATPDEVTLAVGCFLDELRSLTPAPTAIVCTADGYAAGLITAARQRGIRVPEDLSIVGRSNLYYAALTDPPLTTVDVNLHATGEVAAALLLLMIGGARCVTRTFVRPTFVERRSCAALKTVNSKP